MMFHTWLFAVFFAIFYPVYLAVRKTRLRTAWLLAASYIFYGCWSPFYLVLILYATTVDYWAVVGMSRCRRKAPWLVLSIANNLGLLAFFKYGFFLVANVNGLLQRLDLPYMVPDPDVSFASDALNGLFSYLGLSYTVAPLRVLLPVGISFYVLQSMSYTIDYYRGNVEKEPSFLRYATFVSLFPQLVAGPIERAKNLLPQLRQTPSISRADVADGLSLFVVGMFKKVALADYLGLYVDKIYDAPGESGAPALILATVAFAWQIYFDFSGYTDMARGLGRMMGLRLMLNFNNPYLATGLGDFWRRWHISLSSWFRDYVYIPLGGSRQGAILTYGAILLTMIVSGLWHGATWTFVLWGTVHGLGYALTRAMEASDFYRDRVPTLVKRAWVFSFVTFAWIFFRSETAAEAWTVVRGIGLGAWSDPACPLLMVAMVAMVWIYQVVYESRLRPLLARPSLRVALAVAMLVYLALVPGGGEKAFLYFQF